MPTDNPGQCDETQRAKEALRLAEERIAELLRREKEVYEETETLNEVSRTLAGELDLQKLIQAVTDAGTKLTGARFGAFFHNVTDEQGESYLLYTLSGAPKEAFEKFGAPRNTELFGHTFRGEGVVRSDDIRHHPKYGQNPPHHGTPRGHLPVRSYLASPVKSRSGEVIGGLFFGHPEPGIFTERSERMVVAIASQAAIAIDNARLFAKAEREIADRKRAEENLRESDTRLRQTNAELGRRVAELQDSRRAALNLMEDAVQAREDLGKAHEMLADKAKHLESLVQQRTAELRETIGELEAFSYSIVHDMRAPLRSMRGFAKLLLDEFAPGLDSQGQLYLNRISAAAERMDCLIQDVLSFSRIARSELRLDAVNTDRLVRDLLDTYHNLRLEREHISIEGTLPTVRGNEAALTQCFSNLLGNAVKFVPAGKRPCIRVWAEEGEGRARIFVSDEGIGIAEQAQKRIFELFQRATSGYEGTGIGLAIVKKSVERMGGGVGVRSQAGKGSTFWLDLAKF